MNLSAPTALDRRRAAAWAQRQRQQHSNHPDLQARAEARRVTALARRPNLGDDAETPPVVALSGQS